MSTLTTLKIADINRGADLQARTGMSEHAIDDYMECYERESSLPPPLVFSDGKTRWLADGFHRIEARVRGGAEEIVCEVREGTLRDAILYAAGANKGHGLRRTNDDKRRAASILLNDAEWVQWSNRRIAEHCGVSDVFVGNLRSDLGVLEPSSRRGSDGRSINTGNIGRSRRRSAPTANGSQSSKDPTTASRTADAESSQARREAAAEEDVMNICGATHSTLPQDELLDSGIEPSVSAPPSLAVEIEEIHRTLTLVLDRLPGSDPEGAIDALAKLITDANAYRACFLADGDE